MLVQELRALEPDCILIEGPEDANGIASLAAHQDMKPPVALMVYRLDKPEGTYFPMAEFSPEWQALQYAVSHGVKVSFMDLPCKHTFALQDRNETVDEEGVIDQLFEDPSVAVSDFKVDPIELLAKQAGCADSEQWWSRMVEEQPIGSNSFEIIHEAVAACRESYPNSKWGADFEKREAMREAWMRQRIREAVKAGHERIAVVCGAWHVSELQRNVTIKADAALLTRLPSVKVDCSWSPWTYAYLQEVSGYGSGIDSPGWYQHLWDTFGQGQQTDGLQLCVSFMAKVAKEFRAADIDCSSAHLISASRLACSLAQLRGYSMPSLPDLKEAVVSCICMGDHLVANHILKKILIGETLGSVPEEGLALPLQHDMLKRAKQLRLKVNADHVSLELDLRKETDLAKSHLLHQLNVLGVGWGTYIGESRGKGTFKESWNLSWSPECQMDLVSAGVWGSTVKEAALAYQRHVLNNAINDGKGISLVIQGIEQALNADLIEQIPHLIGALQELSAQTSDVRELMQGLPSLAGIYRYGSVRKFDASSLELIIDSMVVRVSNAIALTSTSIDEATAYDLRNLICAFNEGIKLREDESTHAFWNKGLAQLVASKNTHGLISGLAHRLLFDGKVLLSEDIAVSFSRNVSSHVNLLGSAFWFEGFLNEKAAVLLVDETLWKLINDWMMSLADDEFVSVLPLIRRAFADFPTFDKKAMAQKAKRGDVVAQESVVSQWDLATTQACSMNLNRLLGLEVQHAS